MGLFHWASQPNIFDIIQSSMEGEAGFNDVTLKFQLAIEALLPQQKQRADHLKVQRKFQQVYFDRLHIDFVLYLLATASHPAVTRVFKNAAQLWYDLVSLEDEIVLYIKDNAQVLVQRTYKEMEIQQLGNRVMNDSLLSYTRVIGCIFSAASKDSQLEIIESLRPYFAREDHDQLTTFQVNTYQNIKGQFIGSEVPGSGKSQKSEETTTSKKGASQKPASAKGGKPKQSQGAKIPEAQLKQQEQQQEIFFKVLQIEQRYAKGFEIVNGIALASPIEIENYLSQLSPMIQPLLTSPIVGDNKASETTQILCQCLPTKLAHIGTLILPSLTYCVSIQQNAANLETSEKNQSLMKYYVKIVLNTTYQLAVKDKKRLKGSSYSFLFPIFKATLLYPVAKQGVARRDQASRGQFGAQSRPQIEKTLQEQALQIVAKHVNKDSDLPREAVSKLLYKYLEKNQSNSDMILESLCNLFIGFEDNQLPAAFVGLESSSELVRNTALKALQFTPFIAQNRDFLEHSEIITILYLVLFDPDSTNAEQAQSIWEENGYELPKNYHIYLLQIAKEAPHTVQQMAARGLAMGVSIYPETLDDILSEVVKIYQNQKQDQESDAFDPFQDLNNTIVPLNQNDTQIENKKVGMAQVTGEVSKHFSEEQMNDILKFLLQKGFQDESVLVSEAMVQAAMRLVDFHGDGRASSLLLIFEDALRNVDNLQGRASTKNKKDPKAGINKQMIQIDEDMKKDFLRAQIVRVLGTLAIHLDPYNQKVIDIINLLVSLLKTPSEDVQNTVSTCLQDVIKTLSKNQEVSLHYQEFKQKLVQQLLDTTMTNGNYAERRGAAYGLGGVARGLGLKALREMKVLDTLKSKCNNTDTSTVIEREGCMMAFECMIRKLNRLFEPYIVNLLPVLISQFGDKDQGVRTAAEETGKVIMANLTQQGVSVVLPALLQGVNSSKGWRTMVFSITLLGAMSNCAPKQLSNCLPQIVPVLQRVLNDPHPKVQEAATKALNEIGSIISDPAMQNLVPYLVRALTSPEKYMGDAMSKLTETSFATHIDAASLALVMPILSRGIRDRHTDVKKMAGRAIGNLSMLIQDVQDLRHHLPQLLPGLEGAIVDPNLEVRAISSRALANLLRELGENEFGDLFSKLMGLLVSEKSSIERMGSAQALAEIFAVLGETKLDESFPNIINNCSNKSWYVREGHLTLFQFLPYTCEEAFSVHLEETMVVVLQGLADEIEGVRQAAFLSGETLVNIYGETSLTVLLPQIEKGILSEKWRTRQGAIEYVGKLLYQIAGINEKVQGDGFDSDEEEQSKQHNYLQKITTAIGLDQRNKVLSEIYVARSDTNMDVKQISLNIWKAIVTNTPKTLTEILPELIRQIVDQLASRSDDIKTMASRCLGEMVQKMGHRIMDKILPVLKREIHSINTNMRQGVCRGLKEILLNLGKYEIPNYIGDFITPLQQALVDPDPAVRDAAGGAFSILFKGANLGSKDDQVLPAMISSLDNPKEFSKSLEGLKVIIGVKPQVYKMVVPKLVKRPYKVPNVNALGSLFEVAGSNIQPHIVQILYGLLPLLSTPDENGLHDQNGTQVVSKGAASSQPQTLKGASQYCLETMALNLPQECLDSYIIELLQAIDKEQTKFGACQMLSFFCTNSRLDLGIYTGRIILTVGELYANDSEVELQEAIKVMNAVVKNIPKQDMSLYIKNMSDALSTAKDKQRRKRRDTNVVLPAFTYPQYRPLESVLTVYLQTLLLGSNADQKEMAADAIGEVVQISTPEVLKPHVIQIAGPLIRVLGDRFPWQVKTAISNALGILLNKVPAFLKPFVAQLQTSFMRCLNDGNPQLRNSAAKNLGLLSNMSPRIDFLGQELITNAVRMDEDMKLGYLKALHGLLKSTGAKLKEETVKNIGVQLVDLMTQEFQSSALYKSIAQNLGIYSSLCPNDDFKALMEDDILDLTNQEEWLMKYSQGNALIKILERSINRVQEHGFYQQIMQIIFDLSEDQKVQVKKLSVQCIPPVVIYEVQESQEKSKTFQSSSLNGFIPIFKKLLGSDQPNDVQIQTLNSIRKIQLAFRGQPLFEQYSKQLVPIICQIIQGTTLAQIRITCENVICFMINLTDDNQSRAEAHKKVRQMSGTVPQLLTETYIRRISRQQVEDSLEPESTEEEELNDIELLV